MEENNIISQQCPYCSQIIEGDALYIMNHVNTCKQQFEANVIYIKDAVAKNEANKK